LGSDNSMGSCLHAIEPELVILAVYCVASEITSSKPLPEVTKTGNCPLPFSLGADQGISDGLP